MLENRNDEQIPNEGDPDNCAYYCLAEESFNCMSFDVCPSKNLCYLSKSTADDGQLVDNDKCSHYSREFIVLLSKTARATLGKFLHWYYSSLMFSNEYFLNQWLSVALECVSHLCPNTTAELPMWECVSVLKYACHPSVHHLTQRLENERLTFKFFIGQITQRLYNKKTIAKHKL